MWIIFIMTRPNMTMGRILNVKKIIILKRKYRCMENRIGTFNSYGYKIFYIKHPKYCSVDIG